MSDEQAEAQAGIPVVTIGIIIVRGEVRDGKKTVTVQVQCEDANLALLRRAVLDFVGEVPAWDRDDFLAHAAVQFAGPNNVPLDKAVKLAYALQGKLREKAKEVMDGELQAQAGRAEGGVGPEEGQEKGGTDAAGE